MFDNWLIVGLTPQFDHRKVQFELFSTDDPIDYTDQLLDDEDYEAVTAEIESIKRQARAVMNLEAPGIPSAGIEELYEQ